MTEPNSDIAFLCLDLETTGLKGQILEISIVAADVDLNVVAAYTSIIHPGNLDLAKSQMNEFVTEMHTQNGLLGELEALEALEPVAVTRTYGVKAVEQQALQWLTNLGLEPGKFPMFGSTIGFDRGRLEIFMPELEAWFHYRNIDISTVKELVKVWSPDSVWEPSGSKAHRTLQDCMQTLDEAASYKDSFFL